MTTTLDTSCSENSGGATGRTGEDTPPLSSLQDQVSNLSKSGEKNGGGGGGGGGYVCDICPVFRSNLINEVFIVLIKTGIKR
jgi:hypothetical protein